MWARAEATVAKRSDLGANDVTYTTSTHLGNLLKVGDLVWGYCVAASALSGEVGPDESALLPDVVLVKKSYSERRRRPKRRGGKLRGMQKEEDPGVTRGRGVSTEAYEADYEEFMQDLEEDPSLRSQINLYKDEAALQAQVHINEKSIARGVFGRAAAAATAAEGATPHTAAAG